MLVLGLNTAFTAMEAALVRDGEIIADARETMARGQDKALLSPSKYQWRREIYYLIVPLFL